MAQALRVLGDLIDQDLQGWQLVRTFALRVEEENSGERWAIIASTGERVVTTEIALIADVSRDTGAQGLCRRHYVEELALYNASLGLAFSSKALACLYNNGAVPMKIMTADDYSRFKSEAESGSPFVLAHIEDLYPGVI